MRIALLKYYYNVMIYYLILYCMLNAIGTLKWYVDAVFIILL